MTRILQLTDLHVFSDEQSTLKGIPTRETLDALIDHILSKEGEFDHVIITGDHTHDEQEPAYRYVRDIMSPWADRLWQVPGNHDDRVVMRQVFGDRITGSGQDLIQFSFQAGNWHCAGLDTHIPGEVSGRIESRQIEWLSRILADSAADHAALFLHHPPVLVGSTWMDAIGLDGRDKLQDFILASDKVKLVCFGHVHHEFSFSVGRAQIVSTPSTGIQFDPAGDTPHFATDAPGYRVIELQDDSFRTHVVRLSEARYVPNVTC